jgi:hypothetical protein
MPSAEKNGRNVETAIREIVTSDALRFPQLAFAQVWWRWASPLHQYLLHAGCPSKIILGDQQVALLGNLRGIAKPRADDVDRELTLELGLPTGPRLSNRYDMDQSWPARNAGSKVAGTLRCAVRQSSRHTPLCRQPK